MYNFADLKVLHQIETIANPKGQVMVAPDYADESFYALKWALDKLFTSMATVDAATSDGSPQNVGVVYLVHFSAQV